MIFSLLLTYAMAASQPMICEHVFDPNYCTGQPAAGAPGFVCMWQPNEFECKAINMNNPKDACKVLSHNQPACQAKPECRFDLYDGECKGKEFGERPEYERPEYEHGMLPVSPNGIPAVSPNGMPPAVRPGQVVPQTHQPGAPSTPATGAGVPQTQTTPSTGQQTPQNTVPGTAAGNGAFTPTAVIPVSSRPPFAGPVPQVSTQKPTTLPPQAPAITALPVPMIPNPFPPAPISPTGYRFCKALAQVECFGPSSEPGKLCYWDAEDMECSEATRGSVEAVCKQFARSPTECDAHENCFWDAKDYECSEIEFGMGFRKPVLTQQCSTFRSVNDCAFHSTCFWDTASNLCVNVVQASNVCGVYNTAALCATNRLCHFRNGICALDQANPMSGLHLQNVHEDTQPASTSSGNDYFVMFACGFSGALLGLLLALGMQKMCTRKASQEDYRDIVLDVNSHRRQVV